MIDPWVKMFDRSVQGFIQAIVMSGRWHKKLNFLIEFQDSIFILFYFKKHVKTDLCRTYIPNKLAC